MFKISSLLLFFITKNGVALIVFYKKILIFLYFVKTDFNLTFLTQLLESEKTIKRGIFKVAHVGIQTWLAQWPTCTPTHDFKGTNLLK